MNSLQNPLNANYPQDVTQKPGENAVFIVYALKDLPDTIDTVSYTHLTLPTTPYV